MRDPGQAYMAGMIGELLFFAHRHARVLIVAAAVGAVFSLVSGGEAVAHHIHWR
ncbi:hypothetical protein [uncultured Brevundimonas sp.]|uniref:hypothetical protein n=1 Tax=uncultured Brevundimonas sp. TaxID=213418 RepID=UPI0025FE593B|nr:hypothetical protein [uncultured Brevundimonas sp.]